MCKLSEFREIQSLSLLVYSIGRVVVCALPGLTSLPALECRLRSLDPCVHTCHQCRLAPDHLDKQYRAWYPEHQRPGSSLKAVSKGAERPEQTREVGDSKVGAIGTLRGPLETYTEVTKIVGWKVCAPCVPFCMMAVVPTNGG